MLYGHTAHIFMCAMNEVILGRNDPIICGLFCEIHFRTNSKRTFVVLLFLLLDWPSPVKSFFGERDALPAFATAANTRSTLPTIEACAQARQQPSTLESWCTSSGL